ncbi:MAG: LacI family transcriptional regulator [Bifidobacteriaceae bacterium]|jgi:LacI family transcriptional regulator|nr:LacI family transcriptional regulator [Bifidobacteriaceae bacterium]
MAMMLTESSEHPSGAGRRAVDVARLLGVSQATVSYALRGLPGVSPKTRRLVIATAERMGIAIPALEAADQPVRRPALGLILADIGNPFYSDLAAEVSAAARRRGYDLFVSHTGDDPGVVANAVRALVDHGIEGVMLTAAHIGQGTAGAALRASGTPFVQISRGSRTAGDRFVGIDDEAAGKQLMRHVIHHGYRDIAVAAGPASSAASAARAKGFVSALRESGINLPRGNRFTTDLSAAGGWKVAAELLNSKKLPEVVVCGTDAMAIGMMEYLRERGVEAPGEVALTGFDGLRSVGTHAAALTSVVQPRVTMAREAVRMLDGAITGRSTGPLTVVCAHSLRIGRSCGCRRPLQAQRSC